MNYGKVLENEKKKKKKLTKFGKKGTHIFNFSLLMSSRHHAVAKGRLAAVRETV